MQVSRKQTLVGRYAIYFLNISDTLKERRRRFFGRDASAEVLDAVKTDESTYPAKQAGIEQDTAKGAKKQEPSPKEEAREELEEAVERGQNILIEASAVFPFDVFPDTIIIDRQKLTVVHKRFFSIARQKVSVQLSDIKNVQAELGPLFGSLTFTSEHFINNTQTISYLPRKDVLAIQQMVQGFIVAHDEGVDLTQIDNDELKEKLNELGRGEPGERPVVR